MSTSLKHANYGTSLELRQTYVKYLLITIDSLSFISLKLPTTAKMAGVDYKPFDYRLFVEVKGEKLDDAEAAEAAAAKKAADDAAAEELRAAEEEAAALPAAERAVASSNSHDGPKKRLPRW